MPPNLWPPWLNERRRRPRPWWEQNLYAKIGGMGTGPGPGPARHAWVHTAQASQPGPPWRLYKLGPPFSLFVLGLFVSSNGCAATTSVYYPPCPPLPPPALSTYLIAFAFRDGPQPSPGWFAPACCLLSFVRRLLPAPTQYSSRADRTEVNLVVCSRTRPAAVATSTLLRSAGGRSACVCPRCLPACLPLGRIQSGLALPCRREEGRKEARRFQLSQPALLATCSIRLIPARSRCAPAAEFGFRGAFKR